MSKDRSYRVREQDSLPKLMSAKEWVSLVTETRRPHPALCGVVAFDCGQGLEPCVLGWTGEMAVVAPLARLSGRLRSVWAADVETIDKWALQARRGDFEAQISRTRKVA